MKDSRYCFGVLRFVCSILVNTHIYSSLAHRRNWKSWKTIHFNLTHSKILNDKVLVIIDVNFFIFGSKNKTVFHSSNSPKTVFHSSNPLKTIFHSSNPLKTLFHSSIPRKQYFTHQIPWKLYFTHQIPWEPFFTHQISWKQYFTHNITSIAFTYKALEWSTKYI